MTHPVQACREGLYDLLKSAIPKVKDQEVCYGIPGEEARKRFVCIANGRHKGAPATNGMSVQVAPGIASYARNLTVEVDVAIQVRTSKDPLEVDRIAWELASAAEDAIRSDHTLGGAAWNSYVKAGDQAQSYESQTNITTLVLTVSAEVRA